MASWLKAAEGLLDAVDKTVSKTVGTLGGNAELADVAGDGIYLSRPRAQQPVASTSAPFQYPAQPAAYGSSAQPSQYSQYSASNTASSQYQPYAPPPAATSSSAPSAATPAPGGSSGYGAAAAAVPGGDGGAGGFMMRADGPIPFGAKPPGPPPAAVATFVNTAISRNSSQSALSATSPNGGAPASTATPAAPTGPAAAASTAASTGWSTPGSTGTAGSAHPTSHPPAPAASAAGVGPLSPSSAPFGARPSSAAPASSAFSPPVPGGSPPAGGPGDSAHARRDSSETGGPPAGRGGSSSGHPPLPPRVPSSSGMAHMQGTAPAPAPASQPPAAAGPAASPSAAAAAATSAVSTAAATLASATSSFFNLVLDQDPHSDGSPETSAGGAAAPGSAAAGGGSTAPSGAAAQQVAALTRTVEQLRKRLEASRLENEQLEDMLARAEVKAQQEAALVASLREGLAAAQQSKASGESTLAAQLQAARSSLAEVSDKYEASQRQVLVLEGSLAALEESARRLAEQHSDREGGIADALRAELSSTEARLAAERKAHQATRSAAAQRELDLEQQLAGSGEALADLTRQLEEAGRKGREVEEQVIDASRARHELLAQIAALRGQLQAAGLDPDGAAEGGPGARGAAAAAAVQAELEALRGEVLQHRRAAAAAQQAADVSGAQVAAMGAELEALRASIEQRKDTTQLEAQLREVSEMLYLKQTQLERLAAEKAAQQLKTERELEHAKQELAKLARSVVGQGGLPASSHASTSGQSMGSSADQVIPMDALGEPYQRLLRHNRVGKAVKAAANFLDSTASTASFVLRQYPLARPAAFAYLLLIHLYVYVLIARMQRMATHMEASTAPGAT